MRRALLLVALLAACGSEAPPVSCGAGGRAEPDREARVRTALASIAEGRALAEGWLAGVRAICFVEDSLSVVTSDHVVRLDRRLSDVEAAARLGHLLVHERDGHPMGEIPAADADCAALVHEALVLESRAYAVESRLRAALAVREPLMPFEIEAETAPLSDDEASARWLAYLEAHPTGAPGIDALGAGYLAQCEAARR